eukprot:PLAT9747.1.p1 GENE.PLAT9747.1~~PLAT9747.1.p1  ORF type:complete len:748 (+),score=78.03 PLAT9747.1:153-2396(+)
MAAVADEPLPDAFLEEIESRTLQVTCWEQLGSDASRHRIGQWCALRRRCAVYKKAGLPAAVAARVVGQDCVASECAGKHTWVLCSTVEARNRWERMRSGGRTVKALPDYDTEDLPLPPSFLDFLSADESEDEEEGAEDEAVELPARALVAEPLGRMTEKAVAVDKAALKIMTNAMQEQQAKLWRWVRAHPDIKWRDSATTGAWSYQLCCRLGVAEDTDKAVMAELEELGSLARLGDDCFLAMCFAAGDRRPVFRLARCFKEEASEMTEEDDASLEAGIGGRDEEDADGKASEGVDDDDDSIASKRRWRQQLLLRRLRLCYPTQISRCLTLYDVISLPAADGRCWTVWIEELPVGTLQDRLVLGRCRPAEAMVITRQLCDSVALLHRHAIHREISARTVVITPGGVVKLVILPSSRYAIAASAEVAFRTTTDVEQPAQPPEVVSSAGSQHAADTPGDVYMAGQLLAQLWSGSYAFGTGAPGDQEAWAASKAAFARSELAKLPDLASSRKQFMMSCSPHMRELSQRHPHVCAMIRWMLAAHPQERPTMVQICGHPALQAVEVREKVLDILHDLPHRRRLMEVLHRWFSTDGELQRWTSVWERAVARMGVDGRYLDALRQFPEMSYYGGQRPPKFPWAGEDWSTVAGLRLVVFLRNCTKHYSDDFRRFRSAAFGRRFPDYDVSDGERAWKHFKRQVLAKRFPSVRAFFTDYCGWAWFVSDLYRADCVHGREVGSEGDSFFAGMIGVGRIL